MVWFLWSYAIIGKAHTHTPHLEAIRLPGPAPEAHLITININHLRSPGIGITERQARTCICGLSNSLPISGTFKCKYSAFVVSSGLDHIVLMLVVVAGDNLSQNFPLPGWLKHRCFGRGPIAPGCIPSRYLTVKDACIACGPLHLDRNENAYGPSDRSVSAMQSVLNLSNRYPSSRGR